MLASLADYYCDTHNIERIDADELLEAVKQAGYEIFRRKHNTVHGIAASVFRIIQAIKINERSVLPVGTMMSGQYGVSGVVLSLPTVVGKKVQSRFLLTRLQKRSLKHYTLSV